MTGLSHLNIPDGPESETLHSLNVFSLYTREEKVYAGRNALIYHFARRYDDRSADSPEFP